jgi:hypothetical protein
VAIEVVSGDPHRTGLITLYVSRVPTQKKFKKLCNSRASGTPQVGGGTEVKIFARSVSPRGDTALFRDGRFDRRLGGHPHEG